MISILIPVFNYNIVPLVQEIHRQIMNAEIDFEILAHDDGSDIHFCESNEEINKFSFTNYSTSKHNIGRELTRQILATKAKYNWLLFLDADTLPAAPNFIKNYLSYLNSTHDAIFGGILYQEQPPEAEYILRWKYGVAREALEAKARNKNPYQAVVSANFMIKKTIFTELNAHITAQKYGNDILFAALLKSNAIQAFHIDNQVYHLGIEKSVRYLTKNEEAVATYLTLLKNGSISFNDNNLLSFFSILKRYKLNYTVSTLFKLFKSPLRRNLLGKNPNIALLQLYRLTYMCFIDLKTLK